MLLPPLGIILPLQGGPPTSVWTQTVSEQSTQADISIRNITAALASVPSGARRLRATFKSGNTVHLAPSHCAIGKHNGTTSQTTTTPLELLFSGASGFDIPANGTITSDWIDITSTFSVANGDKLVVILDIAGSGHCVFYSSTSASDIYYKVSASTYNQANPASMSGTIPSQTYSATSVEARW